MAKCLVFGGSVFVGEAIVRKLIESEYDVYALTRGNHLIPEGCKHLKADRNDASQLKSVLEKHFFDIVIDVSAYTPTQTKLAIKYLKGKIDHYIHISSAAVYLSSEEFPLCESSSVGINPIWGDYGAGKYLCEKELSEEYQQSGFPVTIFRPFYIYGPNNNHEREIYIFKRLIQRKTIVVPGGGRPIVQFGHIDDLTNAIMQCLLNKESFGQIYNISGKSYVTFKGWIESCGEAIGIGPKMIFVESKEVGFKAREWFPFREVSLFGSTEKIENQLGIYSCINLVNGLKETFEKFDKSLLKEPILLSNAERSILYNCHKNNHLS